MEWCFMYMYVTCDRFEALAAAIWSLPGDEGEE
jgi:hypothetical protein